MTDQPPPEAPKETDPEQSQRFRNAVSELEAAGGLNPTEAERRLSLVLQSRKAVKRERNKNEKD